MLYTISPREMKRIERQFMAEESAASLTLMERAATHVADAVMPFLFQGSKLLVLCGAGNNGGDGLAAARHPDDADGKPCAAWSFSWKGAQSTETAEANGPVKAV